MSIDLDREENCKIPKIFYSLDKEDRVSSKWIAHETDKQHKNILRDIDNILRKFNGSNLSQLIFVKESCGYKNREKEYLISLELATILLSHYQGKKSEQALNLVYEALHYYRNRAPIAEREILELKNQIETLKSQSQNKLEKEKKRTYLVPIFDTDIFGEQYVSRFEIKEKEKLSTNEIMVAEVFHNSKIVAGIHNKSLDLFTSIVGSHNMMMKTIANIISKQGEKLECKLSTDQ